MFSIFINMSTKDKTIHELKKELNFSKIPILVENLY